MSTITLELVRARQAELAKMIEQLTSAPAPLTLTFAAIDITLQPGEHYAGAVLDERGLVKHHLVLMAPRPEQRLAWSDAKAWAASVGGELPTPQEQALLYANCKPHLEPAWHWSSETYERDASYAWGCNFNLGIQGSSAKSYEGRAVAVRRV